MSYRRIDAIHWRWNMFALQLMDAHIKVVNIPQSPELKMDVFLFSSPTSWSRYTSNIHGPFPAIKNVVHTP